MIALVFWGFHIVTTVLDSFVSVNLISVVVPSRRTTNRCGWASGRSRSTLLLAVM